MWVPMEFFETFPYFINKINIKIYKFVYKLLAKIHETVKIYFAVLRLLQSTVYVSEISNESFRYS